MAAPCFPRIVLALAGAGLVFLGGCVVAPAPYDSATGDDAATYYVPDAYSAQTYYSYPYYTYPYFSYPYYSYPYYWRPSLYLGYYGGWNGYGGWRGHAPSRPGGWSSGGFRPGFGGVHGGGGRPRLGGGRPSGGGGFRSGRR